MKKIKKYIYFTELGLEGVAKSSFAVNESPVSGRCSIKPQSGVELDTEFTLFCKEWRDKVCGTLYSSNPNRLSWKDDKLLCHALIFLACLFFRRKKVRQL